MARVVAVEKAGNILGLFSAAVTQMSVRQIAERSGLPRSTVHGLCSSLCATGLLERADGGGYRLGQALVGLGGQVIDRTGMVAAAEGILDSLPHRPGLEAHLGQLAGGWIVYLHRVARPPLPPMRNRVGLRAPAHLSGCGKAALSQLEPADVESRVDEVCRREDLERVDLAALLGELHEVRERGYVINTAFQQDRRSIGVAVGGIGRPIGGISLAGPSDSFDVTSARQAVDRVATAARAVSRRLDEVALPRWAR